MTSIWRTLPGGLVLAATLAACGDSITFPDSDPFLEGVIVEYDSADSELWVKEDVEDECGTRFSLRDAEIGARRSSGAVERLAAHELRVGEAVRVWGDTRFSYLDSCPGQWVAVAVELVR